MSSRGGFTFLVNPASGGGAAPQAVVPVARRLREAGARVEVTYSPGPRAVRELVDAAVARDDVVVSVGGDGMLSSLAGAVSRAGGVLGLVRAGRGNDFARMLGQPEAPDDQARVLLSGREHRVDLLGQSLPGREERIVAGSVYAGVDARTAATVDRLRWLPLRLQYPVATLRQLATYRAGRYRLVLDGEVSEHDAATVVVANSAYYGKGMRIAPPAVLDDGLLDVVVIEARRRVDLIRRMPSVYDGSHVRFDAVHLLRGRRVELQGDSGSSIPVGGDGEPLGHLPGRDAEPMRVRVLPGALRILAP